MKLRDGRITILSDNEGVDIELRDYGSSIDFVKVRLTSEQFTKALSRLSFTECEVEVFHLDLVGKTQIHKNFEFEMPDGVSFKDEKKVAEEIVKRDCPEGWEPDLYFGSQNSFFTKDDKKYARTIIRRWV